MTGNRWRCAVIAWVALSACRGDLVESPRAAHDRRDAELSASLERQLGLLPGVSKVAVVAHRPYADPLAPATPPTAGMASVLMTVYASAPATVPFDARRLVVAALPELTPGQIALVASPIATPPAMADVGPFRVRAPLRLPLTLGLAAGLAALMIAASLLAWRKRPPHMWRVERVSKTGEEARARGGARTGAQRTQRM